MIEAAFSPLRRRALLATACLPWLPAARAAEDSPRREWPRKRATPALELAGIDGSAWRLAAARGRPVLLNFWASWCEPCRAEMPALQQLAREHASGGLQVLAVNYRETEGAVRRFVGQTGLELPVLLDREGAAAKAFGVRIFPSTVGIDRRGHARFVVTGEFDWAGTQAARWVAEL
ncbi:MAG TPA: TlpA disulfide reductase family protein [Ramlibacter sp.]|uniref:TlpA disulfide reductase family protein n=1 Tax=Ramlibacter sp. TaxID=1917967 RepID=UPI002D80B72F|nr:TlpA disulfide reductase family protein [Ramlibacter sp.]HET8744918.1 TlpA disulfide reductase family protein [Ramlibacter sp.]